MKTKSVDEVTTIQALKVPSTIPEKPHFDEDDFNDVTEVIPPASLEDYIHQSMEKAILSDWLNVITSTSKVATSSQRMS